MYNFIVITPPEQNTAYKTERTVGIPDGENMMVETCKLKH